MWKSSAILVGQKLEYYYWCWACVRLCLYCTHFHIAEEASTCRTLTLRIVWKLEKLGNPVWKRWWMFLRWSYRDPSRVPSTAGGVTSTHKTFVWHLYNVGPTSKTLSRRCMNVIQMFCVCWVWIDSKIEIHDESQQTQDVQPLLFSRWSRAAGDVPTLKQNRVEILCLVQDGDDILYSKYKMIFTSNFVYPPCSVFYPHLFC